MQLGLYQDGVAELIGVSTDTITFWENGRFKPMIRHYPAIISFLGYNPFLTVPESLGDRISSFRKLQGFSIKRFGQLIGVDGSTVSGWETGQSVPRKSTLRNLIKILGRVSK